MSGVGFEMLLLSNRWSISEPLRPSDVSASTFRMASSRSEGNGAYRFLKAMVICVGLPFVVFCGQIESQVVSFTASTAHPAAIARAMRGGMGMRTISPATASQRLSSQCE